MGTMAERVELVLTCNVAYLHGNCAMNEFTSCLDTHLVNWYVEQYNYVKICALAESMNQSEKVYFTWLLGINAMVVVYWRL